MSPVSLPLLLLLASSAHAAALGGDDGHPRGHFGKTWEVVVGVCIGLLLCGAAITIIVVTIRQRRRKLRQAGLPSYTYASNPPPALLPSIPYGISRPSSVHQPRDKHGRKGSPDRSSRVKESA